MAVCKARGHWVDSLWKYAVWIATIERYLKIHLKIREEGLSRRQRPMHLDSLGKFRNVDTGGIELATAQRETNAFERPRHNT